MRKNVKNLKASVRARLQNKAAETGRPFAELLQYYGMERFLYRFCRSRHADKFILKGALMFLVWDLPARRTTLDIDLESSGSNQVEEIENIIKEICTLNVEDDGLEFDPQTVNGQEIIENADYFGVRIKLVGFLNRSRIPIQIDVGFGDPITPDPQKIKYPVLLDMPPPNLQGYPVESLASEKLEVIVKLGSLNSRMKDFYDIWVLMHHVEFDGKTLSDALGKTFKNRKTTLPHKKPLFDLSLYDRNSDRQVLWKTFLEKNDMYDAPEFLEDVVRAIEKFFLGPLSALYKSETFNKKWQSGSWG